MFYFPFNIWDVSLPIDELIFFKIVSAPPTSKYLCIFYVLLSHHFHENTGPGVPSSNGPPHLFVQGILRDRGTLPRWVGTEDAAAGRRRIAVVGGGAQMMGKPWENHRKMEVYPLVMSTGCYWKYPNYSEFSHENWWFSIVFCMFTRG